MTSVQIYTNTSSAHFATTTGGPDGAKFVAPLVAAADTPASHLPQATKPNATSHPNSLFTGSSLNYLRIKLLTDSNNANLGNIPQFYVYGWSRELTTGWWESRLLASLKPGVATIGSTSTVTWPGVGTVREIVLLGDTTTAPAATPHRGDAKLYQSFAGSGGAQFLVDTIGTEFIEIHFTQATSSSGNFYALCAGL
jgi:hypothetical protein